jgi:hypothetical protein
MSYYPKDLDPLEHYTYGFARGDDKEQQRSYFSYVIKRVASWYRGVPILPCPGEHPAHNGICYQQSLLARILKSFIQFIVTQWKWIISTIIAILAIIIKVLLNRRE